MRIVEKDFIMKPCGQGLFDLVFLEKVKDEEGQIQIKPSKPCYGCSLASCIRRINKHRLNTAFESENVYLLEALNEIIKLDKEIVNLCRESLPEKFDTGG